MLDLNPRYLIMVRALLTQHVPQMTVWAYGSRVAGQAHEGSDLDLVVIDPNDPTLPQKNLVALRAAFIESALPILVEVMDWARIPASFQQEISRQYVVVHEAHA